MDSTYTPYIVYVKEIEQGKSLVDLSCIPTELLLPLKDSIPTELWRRSEKTTFQADRENMELRIDPKQLTLFEKKII